MHPAQALDLTLWIVAVVFFASILFFCALLDWGWWGFIPSALLAVLSFGINDLISD